MFSFFFADQLCSYLQVSSGIYKIGIFWAVQIIPSYMEYYVCNKKWVVYSLYVDEVFIFINIRSSRSWSYLIVSCSSFRKRDYDNLNDFTFLLYSKALILSHILIIILNRKLSFSIKIIKTINYRRCINSVEIY